MGALGLAKWIGAFGLIKFNVMIAATGSKHQSLMKRWNVFKDMQPLTHAWSDAAIVLLGPDPDE